jgi:hypothetical protein
MEGQNWSSESEVFGDAKLLALRLQESATSQGMQAASGSWKRQGNDSLYSSQMKHSFCQHLNFSPAAKPISDS